MAPGPLRFAFVIEFLLAILVILSLWSEVGGQGHLDLMPWYAKLLPVLALAFIVVQTTAASVTRERAWNRLVGFWLIAMLLHLAFMAALTYYYHLHEDENAGGEGGVTAFLSAPSEGEHGE